MKMETNLVIAGSHDKPISLDIVYKSSPSLKPVVIFVHGFKGFKDWGHFNQMAQTFANAGFVFVKFNFSHNGTTLENPSEFEDLDSFGKNNYLIELNDLDIVISWVQNLTKSNQNINGQQIYLLGHSRGGGISILKAAEDKRISKIVTWASVSDFLNRYKEKTISEWKTKGVIYAFNARTKQNMPLYYQFYEVIQNNKERLNIKKAAKKLSIPFLIIHGTADEAVSFHDAEELHQSSKHSELLVIEAAGHTFEVKHPFLDIVFPKNGKKVIDDTIMFFNRNFVETLE